MAQCKANTNDGTQCEREARDGLEYCAIPSHAKQELVEVVVTVDEDERPQYGIAILDVGTKSAPEIGGFSGKDTQDILQDYHDRGYDLFSVFGGEEKELANSLKYTKMIYTFKLRE